MKLAVVAAPGTDRSSIEGVLREEGCSIISWSDTPGAHYEPHSHDHDEVIGVIEGRIDFGIEGKRYTLEPGKILFLPAGTVHTADVPADRPVKYLIGSK